MKIWVLIGCLVLSGLLTVQPTLGQEPPAEIVEDDQIFQKQPLDEHRAKLRVLYRDQIEAYRRSYQQFVVAKEEYVQLQTLSALDTAVQTGIALMGRRDEVLISYVELLHAELVASTGVPLPLKQEISRRLLAQVADLKTHQQAVKITDNREGLASLANQFDLLYPQLLEDTSFAVGGLRFGVLQSVWDRAYAVFADIQTQQATVELPPLRVGERTRSYDQTSRALELAAVDLSEQLTELNRSDKKFAGASSSFAQELAKVAVSMRRITSYLSELITQYSTEVPSNDRN